VREQPLEDLLRSAFAVRRATFDDEVLFSAPSFKHYRSGELSTTGELRFTAISVTGSRCELECEHCRGTLLEPMISAVGPGALVEQGQRLLERGCRGVLVSGGCDGRGRVPLEPVLGELAELRRLGLAVAVHAGLVDGPSARALAEAGVDCVMLDLVGDRETARRVLHLDVGPEDFERSLSAVVEAGLPAVPHVVAGLCFGELRGEEAALRIAARHPVAGLVLVVLRPDPRTGMAEATPVPSEELGRLFASARLAVRDRPVTLGCARPVGRRARAIEAFALRAGFNGIAFPADETVRLAGTLGLRSRFAERCCAMPDLPSFDR